MTLSTSSPGHKSALVGMSGALLTHHRLKLLAASTLCMTLVLLETNEVLAIAGGLFVIAGQTLAFQAYKANSAARLWIARGGMAIAVLALAAVTHGGSVLAVFGLATTTHLTGVIVSPRPTAFAWVFGIVVAVMVGCSQPEIAHTIAFGGVLLIVGILLVDIVAFAMAKAETSQPLLRSNLTGATRVELGRIKQQLDLVTSQLRREKSSREQAEAQLIEAFRAKEAFLATMSHELRTPLNQIIGYSELLIDESDSNDPTELSDDISRIHCAAMNLSDLIENVLGQAQIESGTVAKDPQLVSILELVSQLTQAFAAQVRSRGNTLRLRCPEDIGTIVTDRDKLYTILKNLLSNACKFTQDGTIRLSVGFEADSQTYLFKLSDTGIGIAHADMLRLFRPFEQVDNSRTRRYDGSGLGLAVSRSFAMVLGGELTAESTPGVGSTFSLRIPREWLDLKGTGVIVQSIGT